jgi:hypothetical protein
VLVDSAEIACRQRDPVLDREYFVVPDAVLEPGRRVEIRMAIP